MDFDKSYPARVGDIFGFPKRSAQDSSVQRRMRGIKCSPSRRTDSGGCALPTRRCAQESGNAPGTQFLLRQPVNFYNGDGSYVGAVLAAPSAVAWLRCVAAYNPPEGDLHIAYPWPRKATILLDSSFSQVRGRDGLRGGEISFCKIQLIASWRFATS